MTTHEATGMRLSRRDLIRAAGLGGLMAAAVSVTGPLPVSALASSSLDDTPEGFLAWAYAQRTQAMIAGNTALLTSLYDPANAALLSFEKSRATFFQAHLGNRWHGAILDRTATVSLLNLQVSGSVATAHLYEAAAVTWIPRPQTLPAEAEQLRQREPAKYYATVPIGPRGEITSGVGTRHEVTLVKGASGWRIAKDAYDELDLGYVSPDLVPGSWAAIQWGGPAVLQKPSPANSPTASLGPLLTQRSYNYTAAANYATGHCSGSSYNGSYCNYNSCGGDCANFVSQCFRAGNEVDGGGWNTFSGGCGTCSGITSSYAGTDTWANNILLRNWVISQNRGQAMSAAWQLGIGDIINYDWNGSGVYRHVAIVTSAGGSTLVSCHNIDRCNVAWNLGGASSYLYTQVYSIYYT